MAVYYTSKCPYCKHVYERRKDDQNPYGCPFKKCPNCNREFVDTDYIEPGLLDSKDFKTRAFGWGAPFLIVMGIVIAVVSFRELYVLGIVLGLGIIAFGAFNIICNINWNPSKDEQLLNMIEDSKKRLADPHYVIALWKNGCFVTQELVQWAKKEVGSGGCETQELEKAAYSESNV